MQTTARQLNGPEWDNRQLRDINYIKSKLRYPAGRKIFLPAVIGAAVFILTLLLAYHAFFNTVHTGAAPVFIAAMVCIITFMLANRFFQELKFISIPTGFDTSRNQQLIDAFLKAQHMIVFRHPEAAEVFQIVSKSVNPLKEQREVLLFIADDRRILINSHFTNAGFSLVPGTRHHRQMAAELEKFIKEKR